MKKQSFLIHFAVMVSKIDVTKLSCEGRGEAYFVSLKNGGHLSIKMPSHQYWNSHYKDNMFMNTWKNGLYTE